MAYIVPDDVKKLTGIRPDMLNLSNEQELNDLLTIWIERISATIDVRIQGPIDPDQDPVKYKGIQDVATRTVAKLIAVAMQQRTSPVVQVGDFAISVLNTSDVIRDLAMELKPYKKRRISVSLSSEPLEGES